MKNALKAQAITEAASVVAAIPDVRQALMNYQREFATRQPGAVLDGRDIGTVIAPGADVKLFVVASRKCAPDAARSNCGRGARRWTRRRSWPICCGATSAIPGVPQPPSRPPPDAHLLDTTHLGIDAAFRAAVEIIEAVRTGRKRR